MNRISKTVFHNSSWSWRHQHCPEKMIIYDNLQPVNQWAGSDEDRPENKILLAQVSLIALTHIIICREVEQQHF